MGEKESLGFVRSLSVLAHHIEKPDSSLETSLCSEERRRIASLGAVGRGGWSSSSSWNKWLCTRNASARRARSPSSCRRPTASWLPSASQLTGIRLRMSRWAFESVGRDWVSGLWVTIESVRKRRVRRARVRLTCPKSTSDLRETSKGTSRFSKRRSILWLGRRPPSRRRDGSAHPRTVSTRRFTAGVEIDASPVFFFSSISILTSLSSFQERRLSLSLSLSARRDARERETDKSSLSPSLSRRLSSLETIYPP